MNREFLMDLGERAFNTYLQAFIGLLLVSGALDIAVVQAAAIAAIPAALSAIKSALAERFKSDTISPASLVKSQHTS